MRGRWRIESGLYYDALQTDLSGVAGVPVPVNYPTSLQYTSDEINPISRIGEDLEDIGGPFESVRIRKTYGGDCGMYTMWRGNSLQSKTCYITPYSVIRSDGGVSRKAAERANSHLWNSRLWTAETTFETVLADFNQSLWVIPGKLENASLDALGTTAIHRVQPLAPAIDLSTSVAEFIADRRFFSLPGSDGTVEGEYLNWSLGISPTLSDIKSLREAMKHQDELIAQYERDAGRRIRRRYDFPVEVETTKSTSVDPIGTDGYSLAHRDYYATTGTSTMTCKTTTKKWFSGAFTYPRPEAGWRRTLSELDKVYGIIPGLEAGWNAIPFSFVADYFANLGDVLGNLDSFGMDGLVMPYGYMMCSTTHEVEHDWNGKINLNRSLTPNIPVKLTASYLIEVKQRRPATPFGFGFDLNSLSLRQMSILAALGISAIK